MSKKDFGSRLKEARIALNKTQQEMSRLLDLGKSGFGKYERMENNQLFPEIQNRKPGDHRKRIG